MLAFTRSARLHSRLKMLFGPRSQLFFFGERDQRLGLFSVTRWGNLFFSSTFLFFSN